MKTYDLSIIIPHYNSSDLLEKLLSTIPKDQDIEVIVIDDKSENKHVEYINSLNSLDQYIDFSFLKNETSKKGAGVARNLGLEHANGEWILFADADDYFTNNFYESINKYFASKNEVVFFEPTSIYIDTGEIADRHRRIVKILEDYKHSEDQKSELDLRYNLPGPTCKLIKKDFLDKNNIKFDEILIAEDVIFATKVGYFMKEFDTSDSIIYTITRKHGSSTTSLNKKVFNARLKVKIEYFNFLKNNLTHEKFNRMNISFSGWLFSSLKYGIVEFVKTFLLLKKENVKIYDKRIWNIKFIFKKLMDRYKNLRNNKKYYVKN